MKAAVIGTCDTKGTELKYIRDVILAAGLDVVLIDVSTRAADRVGADVQPTEVARFHPEGVSAVLEETDRGRAVAAMSVALTNYLASRDDLAGVIAAGGSGGTALVAPAFRSLRLGFPKVLVSTVASGNVAPYVGPSDIQMMYSVTDISGLNRLSRVILANAANSLVGMISGKTRIEFDATEKPALGLTMFGVTTPCVQELVHRLSPTYDCMVFHATGTGGQSFEALADSGFLVGALDITTTEVCDLLVGGVFAATTDRFGAFARTELPYVGSCGALDMVNFGAIDTVPPQFRDRLLHVHNANVTLMRTTPSENAEIGAWIAERLNACNGPVRFLIPEKGVSALDAPGEAFFDPEADAALFDSIGRNFRFSDQRQLKRLPLHINDPGFAAAALAELNAII